MQHQRSASQFTEAEMMAMNWIVVKMRTMNLKWNFSELLMGTSCLRRAFLDFSGLLSLNEDVPFRVSGR